MTRYHLDAEGKIGLCALGADCRADHLVWDFELRDMQEAIVRAVWSMHPASDITSDYLDSVIRQAERSIS